MKLVQGKGDIGNGKGKGDINGSVGISNINNSKSDIKKDEGVSLHYCLFIFS